MLARRHDNRGARACVDLSPVPLPDRAPLEFHRRLPRYAPTPLVDAPAVARQLGVHRVLVKDESSRLGLPSYKVLGASWATYRTIAAELGAPDDWETIEDLRAALARHGPRALAAATDGNHGRAVAWMARQLGWSSHILVPADTSAARIAAIESEDAVVTVVPGSYDEAVERAADEAGPTTLVISDTAWPGYDTVPRHVVEGYSSVFWEVDDALAAAGWPSPSVVAVQIGVGSLAAAAVRHYRAGRLAAPPRLIGVEPTDAACMLASVAAGTPVEVPAPHRSSMAGLNCGRVSPAAYPLVSRGFDVLLAVDDSATEHAMRALAQAGIESGESGAAGLAGLLATGTGTGTQDLDADAVVLLLNTEGATDPASYARVMAQDADTGRS